MSSTVPDNGGDLSGARMSGRDGTIDVSVVLALPHRQQCIRLSVAAGCDARSAVRQAVEAGLETGGSAICPDTAPLAIHGERIDDAQRLVAGDRVELLRPLSLDPMEMRRRRARSSRPT